MNTDGLKKALFVLGLAAVSSCGEKHVEGVWTDEFPQIEHAELAEHVQFETDEIKMPVEMAFAGGRLLFRNFSGEHFISVFDAEKGTFLSDMAPRGTGPDEFLFVTSMCGQGEGLSLYDSNLGRIFHAESADGSYGDASYTSIPVPVDSARFCSPLDVFPVRDGVYCVSGLIDGGRFVLLDSTATEISRFGRYPEQDKLLKDFSYIALGFGFQGVRACNASGDRMAFADGMGATFQFYDLHDPSRPSLLCEHVYVLPEFRDLSTEDYQSVGFVRDKNVIGALGVQGYRDKVLILYSGNPFSNDNDYSGNSLLVYGWDGEPEALVKLDRKCKLFAVDEEKGLGYFLSQDEDYSYVIYTLDLAFLNSI